MTERFGFFLRYRFLLTVATVLMLFSNSYAAGGPAEFKHKYLSLTLPAGGSVKGDAVTGNELIGWLQSKNIPGASILIFSYRGALINYTNVRIRGLKRLALDYPKGQKPLRLCAFCEEKNI